MQVMYQAWPTYLRSRIMRRTVATCILDSSCSAAGLKQEFLDSVPSNSVSKLNSLGKKVEENEVFHLA